MPAIIPQYRQQTTASSAGLVRVPPHDPEAETAGIRALGAAISRTLGRWAEQRDTAESSALLSEARNAIAAAEDEERNVPAAQATEELTPRVMRRVKQVRRETLDKTTSPRVKEYLRLQFDDLEAGAFQRATVANSAQRVQVLEDTTQRAIDAGAAAAERDPGEGARILEEIYTSIDGAYTTPGIRSALRGRAQARIVESTEFGRAQQNPELTLERLKGPDAVLDSLTPDARERVQLFAQNRFEQRAANQIVERYRANVRDGDAALAALDESGIPVERQDGIRRRVREGVGLMRDERQGEHLNRIADLEKRIATGAPPAAVFTEIESLYRAGALSPSQVVNYQERAAVNAERTAENEAARREFMSTLAAGLPLNPRNGDHRKFLSAAFGADAGNTQPGDPRFQALALGYASRARMLPDQAVSWLRSAARSPTRDVALAGAEFYGSLEQQSPEAAGDIDTDTRAMLAQISEMKGAGASDQAAFETARSNVFESRRDVVDARTKAYGEFAKQSDSALNSLIDRDFDTAFKAQPAASSALRADFDRQTLAYFVRGTDINRARDLAWADLRRVYGETRVNGDPVVSAFPVERFGVTPEEARADVAKFLRATKQDVKPEDVLIVPDGLTLRAVSDALTGKPVSPSYRLVTKAGDLVLGPDGTPQRYTLPTGEELTKRFKAAQDKARQEADLAVSEARDARARLQLIEQDRRDRPRLTDAPTLR